MPDSWRIAEHLEAAHGGPSLFGGATGPLRLLQSSLGDQAGWLLGFAVVAALALLVVTRLRRDDARTGWLLVIGGAFAATAVAFSFASGIFHPYYVSLLAPFAAALARVEAVAQDGGEPGPEVGAGVKLLAAAPGLEDGLLGQVLGLLDVAGERAPEGAHEGDSREELVLEAVSG